jgi:hypothetical protein
VDVRYLLGSIVLFVNIMSILKIKYFSLVFDIISYIPNYIKTFLIFYIYEPIHHYLNGLTVLGSLGASILFVFWLTSGIISLLFTIIIWYLIGLILDVIYEKIKYKDKNYEH